MRYRLEMLEEKGLVMKQKGRGGTKLTRKGYVAAEKLELSLS
ncbi:winged-helix domain-containing protein [Priestia flexa]|nr:winged-helix domain-containing protein [Priestia flexa]WEZ07097.1 winged-helix domain-containing protein [Priestia flexa]